MSWTFLSPDIIKRNPAPTELSTSYLKFLKINFIEFRINFLKLQSLDFVIVVRVLKWRKVWRLLNFICERRNTEHNFCAGWQIASAVDIFMWMTWCGWLYIYLFVPHMYHVCLLSALFAGWHFPKVLPNLSRVYCWKHKQYCWQTHDSKERSEAIAIEIYCYYYF